MILALMFCRHVAEVVLPSSWFPIIGAVATTWFFQHNGELVQSVWDFAAGGYFWKKCWTLLLEVQSEPQRVVELFVQLVYDKAGRVADLKDTFLVFFVSNLSSRSSWLMENLSPFMTRLNQYYTSSLQALVSTLDASIHDYKFFSSLVQITTTSISFLTNSTCW